MPYGNQTRHCARPAAPIARASGGFCWTIGGVYTDIPCATGIIGTNDAVIAIVRIFTTANASNAFGSIGMITAIAINKTFHASLSRRIPNLFTATIHAGVISFAVVVGCNITVITVRIIGAVHASIVIPNQCVARAENTAAI